MKSILRVLTGMMVFRFTRLVLVAAALTATQPLAVSSLNAAEQTPSLFVNGIRVHDEIVVVNTRMLCDSTDPASIRSGLQVENYAVRNEAGQRQWQASDLNGLLAFDPSVRTIFFVHGNQITPGDAKCDGLEVYRRLMHYGANSPRIRFVIVSWPATKVSGPLRDFRIKAARTTPAGVQLAWLLDQMPAETPVSLIGFSYGARIVTGSLHVLAGGQLNGVGLKERAHPNRSHVNVVWMAAAMHSYWLGEGQYHGLALSQVDRAFSLNSCRDPAMRFYHISVPGRGGPQALGLSGPTRLSSEQTSKVYNRDISRYTGSRHDLYQYLSAPGATSQIWDYLGSESTVATP
jgi:hypothetical protein